MFNFAWLVYYYGTEKFNNLAIKQVRAFIGQSMKFSLRCPVSMRLAAISLRGILKFLEF